MWILNFLPNFVFHLMLLIGIVGIVISFIFKTIPFVAKYHIQMLVISIILTVIAVWYEGGIAKDAEYQAMINDMKLKVAESEKKAAEANAEIEYVFIDRVQKVKDVQVVIQEKIRDVAVNIDDNCKITLDTIDILNKAAKSPRNNK